MRVLYGVTLLCLAAGCELLVDFDRDRIPKESEENGVVGAGGSTVGPDGNPEAGSMPPGVGGADNRAPVARDDIYTAQVGLTLSIASDSGLLQNDSDPDGDVLEIGEYSYPERGLLRLAEDGSFEFLANNLRDLAQDAYAEVTFTYRATDGRLVSDAARVTIVVRGASNPMPEAKPDRYSTTEDTPLEISADRGLAANDLPADGGGARRYSVFLEPEEGTLELSPDGGFKYTPAASHQQLAAGEHAVVTFQYIVTNEQDVSDGALVTITVNGLNDPPVPRPSSAVTASNLALDAPAGALLQDAEDAEGDPLVAVPVTDRPTQLGGLVTIEESGAYTYLPPPGRTAIEDQFSFELSDGNATSTGSATVSVQGPVLWFVDAQGDEDGDGRSTRPFPDVGTAQASAQPGDTIYLRSGRYEGITLQPGQTLIGAGLPLLARLGGKNVTIETVDSPPVLTGTGPLITLADNTDAGGVVLEDSQGNGILGDRVGAVAIHDLSIRNPSARGISLTRLTGDAAITAVAIEDAGTDGLAVLDSAGNVTLREVEVRNPNRDDPEPTAGAGEAPPAFGIRLENNTGGFDFEGGAIRFAGDNRSPALAARNVADVSLRGTDEVPLEIVGVGLGASSPAPSSVFISGAASVSVSRLAIHDQRPAPPADNRVPGALTLIDVTQTIAVEDSFFGAVDGAAPVRAHGVIVRNTAAGQALDLTVRGNRFASEANEPGQLADAIAVEFTGTRPNALLTALIDDNEVKGAGRAIGLTLNNDPPSDASGHDITISAIDGTDMTEGGVSLQTSGSAGGSVVIRDCTLAGHGTALSSQAIGVDAVLQSAALWELSLHDNTILKLGANGVAVIAGASSDCRVSLERNTLSDDSIPVAALGGGILLRAAARGRMNATVLDNAVSWSQHAIITDVADTGELCLNARGNHGEGSNPPAGDFFLSSDGGPIAISQPTVTNLAAANNGADVTPASDVALILDQPCETVD